MHQYIVDNMSGTYFPVGNATIIESDLDPDVLEQVIAVHDFKGKTVVALEDVTEELHYLLGDGVDAGELIREITDRIAGRL